MTPRLLRGVADTGAPIPLAAHRHLHGSLPRLSSEQLIGACAAVRIGGRGGAGFPVARKLESLRRGRRVVVVNGTESELASHKDRLLLTRTPHLVLDGAIVVADAIGAREIRIAVHEQPVADILTWALHERADRAAITVDVVPGGFVSGEARALIRALDGGPALPPGRRTLPTEHGVRGAPTFVSNVETYAQIAVLVALGPAEFATVGTRDEPGTTLLTAGGAVARPGVLEVAIGTPVLDLLALVGASPVAGLVIGGYHGAWVAPRSDLRLSRRGLAAVGGTLGAGAVLVVDEATCALGELTRVAFWLAKESARQCGPCLSGLPALAEDLAAMYAGRANTQSDVKRHASLVTGRGACAHPDAAARFITTGLAAMQQEVLAHTERGGCGRPILGRLPIEAARQW